jgi:hypothetical protein
MSKLRKSLISNENFEPKKGQRKLLRSSKDLIRCPFLVSKDKGSNEIRPVLKSLISAIIEREINSYINNLYAKK